MTSFFSTLFSCWTAPFSPPNDNSSATSDLENQKPKTPTIKETSKAVYPPPKPNPPVYTPPVDWGGWEESSDEDIPNSNDLIDQSIPDEEITIPSTPITATIVHDSTFTTNIDKSKNIEEEEDFFKDMEPDLKPTEPVYVQRGNAASKPSSKFQMSDDEDEEIDTGGWGETMSFAEKAALRNATRDNPKPKRHGLGATKSGVEFDTSDY